MYVLTVILGGSGITIGFFNSGTISFGTNG